jgi:coatomer subunit beta
MDFISEVNSASSVSIISFVKEVVEKFPNLRSTIVERLTAILGEVRAGKVYRGSLWIIGEYCQEEKTLQLAWKRIRTSLGEIPILQSEQRALEEMDEGESEEKTNGHAEAPKTVTKTKVLADGTYATETALTSEASQKSKLEAVRAAQKPPLRQMILDGDYFLATVLCSTLTKLVMRHAEISSDKPRTNALKVSKIYMTEESDTNPLPGRSYAHLHIHHPCRHIRVLQITNR